MDGEVDLTSTLMVHAPVPSFVLMRGNFEFKPDNSIKSGEPSTMVNFNRDP